MYFSPSCLPPPAIYLCKRTMQNKARLELADYEAVSVLSFSVLAQRREAFFIHKRHNEMAL